MASIFLPDNSDNSSQVQPPATDQQNVNNTQPSTAQPTAQPTNQNTQPVSQPQSSVPNTPAATQTDPNANHPAVKNASILHSIAETLAGGPRYRTVIADDGSRTLRRVPMDRKDIGMAIALSAITGALSGLQSKGPNASAEAAGRGFNATAQARQQADQQQDQEAQQDFARKAAVAESNMRMLNNAIQVGRLQREDHDAMVKSYGDMLQDFKDNSPDVIKATGVPESEAKDVQKYPLADYLRIPDGTVPRLDQNGQPVKINGVPQWDNTYSLIDKNAKTSLTDADGNPQPWVQSAVSWGLPGYPESLLKSPVGFQISATAASRAQHQVAMLQALQSELNSFTNSFGPRQQPTAWEMRFSTQTATFRSVSRQEPPEAQHLRGPERRKTF